MNLTLFNTYGLCGASDLQPSCTTFGLLIFAAVMVPICVLTILGMLLFRRRLAPLLKTSAILLLAAFLSFLIPMIYIGLFMNKLGGAMMVMMAFPFIVIFLFGGIGCFLGWITQTMFRVFWKRPVAKSA